MTVHENYIGGEWVRSQETVTNTSPSDLDDVIGEYSLATVAQTNSAIEAAQTAFPAWAETTPQQRFELLDRIGGEILASRDRLGQILAREQGKTLAAASFEVERAGYTFKFFAGEALRIQGERIDSLRPGVEIDVTRAPLGVVALITPWNFPIGIPAWKIAPALAYGNCVVFKPPELVPATSWEMTRIIDEAGIPPGVFNLLIGKGRVVGEAFLAAPKVAGVSFTGSAGVGRRIAAQAVATGKKLQLEMGGKNPLVVADDADLEQAVEAAADGAFYFTGQRCTASSRIIATEGIHDRFVDALQARMRTLTVGHALDADTLIGPVVSQAQLDQNLEYLDVGVREGATLTGGEQLERRTRGHYLAPALFTGTDNNMRINREEIFGPIATVIPAQDYNHALHIANDTEYGLASAIFTGSQKLASHFRRHSQAGLVMVNLPTAGFEYHVPFGGSKASSYGPREQGRYAQEFYTTVKTSYIRPL